MSAFTSTLEPGAWVRHPGQPDWGPGQVQSVIGHRVTVNFEEAGKKLINAAVVALEPAPLEPGAEDARVKP
ncbi:MAG TPA: DUF3553 domain-containing protein [Acetobacteraceae bacterium]|nr:DUF3553 domain-containing protein [Acetobacteraceae bacterium]